MKGRKGREAENTGWSREWRENSKVRSRMFGGEGNEMMQERRGKKEKKGKENETMRFCGEEREEEKCKRIEKMGRKEGKLDDESEGMRRVRERKERVRKNVMVSMKKDNKKDWKFSK